MNGYEDIYKTPTSDIETDSHLPEGFSKAAAMPGKYRFFALLTFFYLIVSLLGIGAAMLSGIEYKNIDFSTISDLLGIVDTLMYIYLILMFRKFLQTRFNFHRVDKHVVWLIGLYVTLELLQLLFLGGGEELDAAAVLYMLLLAIFGVTLLLFGKRLLQIQESYRGIKLYAWSTLLSGLAVASVVGVFIAIIPSIVSDVALMLIFLTAATELRHDGTVDHG